MPNYSYLRLSKDVIELESGKRYRDCPDGRTSPGHYGRTPELLYLEQFDAIKGGRRCDCGYPRSH
ncbi:MAG: hypothetical protein ACON4R_00190 [Akkermansiaceae bacterium]